MYGYEPIKKDSDTLYQSRSFNMGRLVGIKPTSKRFTAVRVNRFTIAAITN